MVRFIYSFSFLFFILTPSCINESQKINKRPSDKAIKVEVNTLLDSWHQAASDAKFDAYFDLMSEKSRFIGTDASENWSKSEFQSFSKPYFDEGKAWDFKAKERTIFFNEGKDLVWFDELLDTWMGVCRGSGVLEKTNESWKIKHYVLSATVPNELMDEFISFKTND